MINKLFLVFVISLLVWTMGMALTWVVGVYGACFFVSGCYQKLGIAGVLEVISIKSILSKGFLLALVSTLFAWVQLRRT
jgi:hypothetical protein